MTILDFVLLAVSCLVIDQPPLCEPGGEFSFSSEKSRVAGVQYVQPVKQSTPMRIGQSLDVELTAQAALAWDEKTGTILYEKNAGVHRPVASLSKLLSALVIQETLSDTAVVEIPLEVQRIQRQGAHIKLPVGEHATVSDLLKSGLIASANDVFVTLAIATDGSEQAFTDHVNRFAQQQGFLNSRVSNATGLAGGLQYSTANDLKEIFRQVYADPLLRLYLSSNEGILHTREGSALHYETTNQLLGTYLPILAGKTGYTVEAGQNVAIMTQGKDGQEIGIIVLGSEARFQDAKVLTEWVWRNYTWQ